MKDEWRVESDLIEHLATELLANRLGLFLGAGQSGFYGLPGWKDLVNRLSQMHSFEPLGDGDDSMLRMARIKSVHYSNQNEEFLADVKKELYKDVSIDFDKIRSSQLLSAIGALLMVSSRGSASTVFTLNYDDLLEIYLEYHGVVTRSICEEVHWANNADVTIYHPHGLLPLSEHRSSSKDIVISAHDYDLIMKEGSVWRNLLVTSLRTHTFLYIGLSGDDPNLKGMLRKLRRVMRSMMIASRIMELGFLKMLTMI